MIDKKSHLEDSKTLETKKKVHVSFYLLPNFVTAASLFLGFYSIKLSHDALFYFDSLELFTLSCYCLLAAIICDGLDGSIARLTHTQSSFGIQFDSLCDLVSFGVAPAFLMYNYSLKHLGKIGTCIAFIYLACATLRLARFNVLANLGKARGNFTGIPVPMAAAPLVCLILAHKEPYDTFLFPSIQKFLDIDALQNFLIESQNSAIVFAIITFLIALGMISTFEYISLKNFKFPRKRPFTILAFILIIIAFLLSFDYIKVITTLLIIYCLHGPVLYFISLFKKKNRKDFDELDEIEIDRLEQDMFEPINPHDK
jgi:CDP-diacylglycerol--serine O-phosphatidyltransferase